MKKYFGSLSNKLEDWHKGNQKSLKAFGVTPNQWAFLLLSLLQGSKDSFAADNQILVCPTPEIADDLYELFKGRLESHSVLSYPGLENSPYGGIVSSERNLMQRFRVLYQLTQEQASPNLILTTKEALLHKCPPATFFESGHLKIEISDVVSPEELAGKLFDLGYQSAPSVEEPGTFSHKGEIFDIFPTNSFPVRLHYFDDMIEAIFKIDPNSQKSLKNQTLESLVVAISPACLARSEYSTVLRNHIPKPGPSFKAKFENRKHIFELLSSRILFENYAAFAPLFFDRPATLCEYLDSNNTVLTFLEADSGSQNTIEYFEEIRAEHEENIESLDSESILPKPSFLYQLESGELYEKFKTLKLNHLEMTSQFDEGFDDRLVFNLENSKIYLNRSANPALKKAEYLKSLFEALKIEFKYDGQLVFSLSHENSRAEIEHLMELFEYPSSLKERTEFIRFPLSEGFYYTNEKTLVLTDSDLFSLKKKKTKTNFHQNVDLFAEQLATLKVGDFVVHNDFGIGEYLGLETMEVGGSSSDFLIIEYASNDKIYLPVYKMNLIQKHADSAASVKPDNLRTNKFKNLKDRAKDSVKKLAFDLLKLQAERESAQAFAFSPPDHYFKEFELDFPFQETVDQLGAIDRVLHDMQKLRPMDHLVCGDVGFGKTEVAMRASFKAVLDQKQVAILVPTTILALQHYNSFKTRFKNFPVKIDFLSRFKSTKEAKAIKEKLAAGEIDIIIGTHALLATTVKYQDLGLVVVDEEQRFGVNHKEKLKVLKATVDFLTLTATPIPRTMQMAFLGLRDLSLIQTAPPKRQSIKTYIVKEDDQTMARAITKEISRGGQVFIVHNRVMDIEAYTYKIRELVPEAKIIYAHGQLPEKELERRMNEFYSGKFNVLIATTIIESGLDIPNANTMIIDRAHTYGLSQLHQLRGRIGRSDKKAYCYFIIPKTQKMTSIAEQRLKALHTYADVGSGFNIASCDLEIRGAGDILGATQSGHIENIGLELYMELLKDAIQELKGERKIYQSNVEIAAPFASYIPNNYILDSSERLKMYKRLSNFGELEQIDDAREELIDIYGPLPAELENLLGLLKVRNHLANCGVKTLQVAGNMVTIQFEKSILESNSELRNRVVESFINRPKVYQFTPDYKVIYTAKKGIDQTALMEFASDLSEKLLPSKRLD